RRVVDRAAQLLRGRDPDFSVVCAVLLGEERVVQRALCGREDVDDLGERKLVLRVRDELGERDRGGLVLGVGRYGQALHVHVVVPGIGQCLGDPDVRVQGGRVPLEVLQVVRRTRGEGDL